MAQIKHDKTTDNISINDANVHRGNTSGTTASVAYTGPGCPATLLTGTYTTTASVDMDSYYGAQWGMPMQSTTSGTGDVRYMQYYPAGAYNATHTVATQTILSWGIPELQLTARSTTGAAAAMGAVANLQRYPVDSTNRTSVPIRIAASFWNEGTGHSTFWVRRYNGGYLNGTPITVFECNLSGTRSRTIDVTHIADYSGAAEAYDYWAVGIETNTTSTTSNAQARIRNLRCVIGDQATGNGNTKLALAPWSAGYASQISDIEWEIYDHSTGNSSYLNFPNYNVGSGTSGSPYKTECYYGNANNGNTYTEFAICFKVLEAGTAYYNISHVYSTANVGSGSIRHNTTLIDSVSGNSTVSGSFAVAAGDTITVINYTGYYSISYARGTKINSLYVV